MNKRKIVLAIAICLLIKTYGFAQTDSVLYIRQIDSILDAGGNPAIFIHLHDSLSKLNNPKIPVANDSLKKDSTAIVHLPDSLQKDSSAMRHIADSIKNIKRGKLAISIGAALNPYPNNLAYSYLANEDKTHNAFIDFKVTPQINFTYISKNYFMVNVEAWEQSGNNVMDNVDSGNSLTVTHFSGSLMHLIKVKTTDKFTIAPYAGIRYSYYTKDLSYLIKYNSLDSSTIPPHLDSIQYLYGYSESSTLSLVQVPLGITFMSKKIIADIGTTLNIYGVAQGTWQSKNNENVIYYQSGNYSKTFVLANNFIEKFIKGPKIKKSGTIPAIGNITAKVGYLFQSKPKKKHRKVIYVDE